MDETTEKLGEVIKESLSENRNDQEIVPVEIDSNNSEGDNNKLNIRSLPNSSIFSELMTKSLGLLMCSSNVLRIKASLSGPTIVGIPIYTLGGNKLRIRDNDYESTPEKYKPLTSIGYSGKTMKNEKDILKLSSIKNDLGYTGVGDRPSNRKIFLTITLPKIIDKIQNKIFEEIIDSSDNDLEGQGIEKNIIASNIIDIYTGLENLLGLKVSGRTTTLTEASNLKDPLYKMGETQNGEQYRNALDKFSTY